MAAPEMVPCKNESCYRLVPPGTAGSTCCVPCHNNMQRGTNHPHAWICKEEISNETHEKPGEYHLHPSVRCALVQERKEHEPHAWITHKDGEQHEYSCHGLKWHEETENVGSVEVNWRLTVVHEHKRSSDEHREAIEHLEMMRDNGDETLEWTTADFRTVIDTKRGVMNLESLIERFLVILPTVQQFTLEKVS